MTPSRSRKEIHDQGSNISLNRLITISDGVFAFAMTLLVLEIKVPAGLTSGDLTKTLLGLGPRLLIYALGFLVIALTWDGHQRIFHYIQQGDSVLLWLNLLTLLAVTLLPASSALLGAYPQQPPAIAFLTINATLISLFEWLLWRYASRSNRLLVPRTSILAVRIINTITLVSVVFYGLASLAAFIYLPLAFLLIFVPLSGSYIIPRNLIARK
jgi:uncharacterized membrane protein